MKYSSTPAKNTKGRREGAGYYITEECERLFCDTLKAVFHGEGNLASQESLVMDMHKYGKDEQDYFGKSKGLGGNNSIDDRQAYITDWLEIWDYVGGATFRGFVANHQGERSLFVFFDRGILGSDLKPGYVLNTGRQYTRLTCLQAHGVTRAMRNFGLQLLALGRLP